VLVADRNTAQVGGHDLRARAQSNTNPFGDDPDTRTFCTVVLADVGAATAVLLNTCSYPSQQPNSNPSDCVLIPGKANPTLATTPTLIPQDSAALSGQSGTGGSVTFQLYKDSALNPGVRDPTELVFSQTDSTSPYATSNSGNPSVNNGYSITTDGTYLWKVTYSGDADNNPAESAGGVEKYVVDLEPNPS
jgi:hypothetical protein